MNLKVIKASIGCDIHIPKQDSDQAGKKMIDEKSYSKNYPKSIKIINIQRFLFNLFFFVRCLFCLVRAGIKGVRCVSTTFSHRILVLETRKMAKGAKMARMPKASPKATEIIFDG